MWYLVTVVASAGLTWLCSWTYYTGKITRIENGAAHLTAAIVSMEERGLKDYHALKAHVTAFTKLL